MIPRLLDVAGTGFRAPIRRLVAGLALEGALVGLGFVLLMPFLEALLAGDASAALRWWAALAGVFALYVLLRWRTQMMGYLAAVALARVLFDRLGRHVAQLPIGWFTETRAGELAVLSGQGVTEIMSLPAHLLRPLIVAFVTPVPVLIAMAVVDWRLALSVAVAVPLGMLAYLWSGALVSRSDGRVHAAAVEATARIVEFAQAQTVLRAHGREVAAAHDLDAALVEQRAAGQAQIAMVAKGLLAFVVVVQAALTLLLVVGVNRALGGAVDVPVLAALLVLGLRSAEPLIAAADLQGAMRIADETLRRMQTLLETPPLPEPSDPTVPQGTALSFEDVSFGYETAQVLHDVSFAARENGLTVIVGPSGAGKSTILRLIPRFHDVTGGRITLGGVDLRDIGTEALLTQVSMVFQDVYLFDGTIAENVRLAQPEASDDALHEACRTARLGSMLDRLPDGLETQVGEGGARLSGGERQRISIARALLKDAPIILLDEALAAIDAEDDRNLRAAMRALTADRTVIAVTHRLLAAETADHVVFLDAGRTTEQGTHAELMAKNGSYAHFVRLERQGAIG